MRVHQPFCLSGAETPEIRQRRVLPEKLTIGAFIQLRDAYPVLVGGGFLCHNVHGDLGEVQVRADADGGRDAGALQHLPDHGLRHDMGGAHMPAFGLFLEAIEIARTVDERLVDAVNVNILRRDIVQVDGENERGDPFVLRHARRGDVKLGFGAFFGVIQTDGLLGLKEPGAGRHADRLEGRGDRETDRLIGAGHIRHQQPGLERIEPARHTFDRGVVGLEIDADTGAIHSSLLPGNHTRAKLRSVRYASASSFDGISFCETMPTTRPIRYTD